MIDQTMTESDSDDDIFPAAYRAAQREQATRLKPSAEKAGLEFKGYLAPRDAIWALEAIERGAFMSPSEIVMVAIQQFIEMSEHPDLRRELLSRTLQKAMDDPRPGIPAEEAFAAIEALIAESRNHQPARWEKVGLEFLPDDSAE
jgi:hypothetical protein